MIARRRVTARLLGLLQPLLRERVFTMRRGLARGMRRRYGPGFKPRRGGPTPEERLLESLALEGATVYDVGGFVGLHTLFFARAVGQGGHVVTFEPNPANVAEIRHNVALNRLTNVTVVPLGLADRAGRVPFTLDPLYPSRGAVGEGEGATIEVEVAPLDRLAAREGLPDPDLIKIDVEGLELAVLRGMTRLLARARPRLFIEMHGENPALLDFLLERSYHLTHVESGRALRSAAEAAVAVTGHLDAQPATERISDD